MTKTIRKKRNPADIAQRVLREAGVQSPIFQTQQHCNPSPLPHYEREDLKLEQLEAQRRSISPSVAKKEDAMLGYAKKSELMNRWNVDRDTVRSAVSRAGVIPSGIHKSPHYLWSDILKKIEGWPADVIGKIDLSASLYCTGELADLLSVTFPTVRNYGKSGKLHEVRLGKRTLRYAFPYDQICTSEPKSAGWEKK